MRSRDRQVLQLLLLLPEQQHKATDKRSEIVLAINFGRRTKRNGSEHLTKSVARVSMNIQYMQAHNTHNHFRATMDTVTMATSTTNTTTMATAMTSHTITTIDNYHCTTQHISMLSVQLPQKTGTNHSITNPHFVNFSFFFAFGGFGFSQILNLVVCMGSIQFIEVVHLL